MSAKTDDVTIILIDGREGVLKSWARDAVSFGGLIGTAYALNTLMPPSGWLNCGLALAWLLWMAGKAAAHRMRFTLPDAIAKLEAMRAPNPTGAPK